ncbi:MAG: hypothetical protein ABSA05_00640 [Opitutaceae bacterium]|jgi:hypothetical protein
MKTKTSLLGCLGIAAGMLAGGCASVPSAGELVYYDSGNCWLWGDGLGWSYLGGPQIRISRNHVPKPMHNPGTYHGHPSSGGGKHHPADAKGYFFFGKDGSVLASRDGSAFWTIGRFAKSGEYVRKGGPSDSAVRYKGAFEGAGGQFHVGFSPGATVSAWAGNLVNAGSGGGGSYQGGGDYSGGGGGTSSGWSGTRNGGGWSGGGGHYSGGGWGGGGHYSGGGGGGGGGHYSGGGGGRR